MDKRKERVYNNIIFYRGGACVFRLYLTAVDIIPAAMVLLPLFGILYCTVYKHNFRKCMLNCLFCLYLAAVFSLVGIPNVTYFRPEVNLNLIPFLGIMEDLKNSVLNILLFVPLGVFLPVLWDQFRNPVRAVSFGLGFSLMIELLQMLTFRATDVNDLITNTLGTMLGYLLAKLLRPKIPAAETGNREVYLLTALSFLVMFFVHPFLSPMIWDRIL